MNASEIGKKLVGLCKEGRNMDCINTYYSPEVVSVEAASAPGKDRTTTGIEGVRGKNTWWVENHVIHGSEVHGPYPHGEDKFAVRFQYDITFKPTNQRNKMDEIGVFTVANGKITREEFFYTM